MRWLLFIMAFATGVFCQAQNLNAFMMNLIEREMPGVHAQQRLNEIIHAFKTCADPEVEQVFITNDFYDETQHAYIKQDSAKWKLRAKNVCYADLDGDAQKEILFHEKDMDKNLQLAVLLKKQDSVWTVWLKEYGVFSNMVLEARQLRALHVVEFHANAYPCDIFKLYKATTTPGHIALVPDVKVHVPYLYQYPVKFQHAQRQLMLTVDSLYFYEVALYDQAGFPYKKEMRNAFRRNKFSSVESAWHALTPSAIYWSGFIESRGHFSSILVAFNLSWSTPFPDYYFIYVPNSYFEVY